MKIIDFLSCYKKKGEFNFTPYHNLSDSCNADCMKGIYIIYYRNDIIYVGCSGLFNNGVVKCRQDGLRGRIVNGKQFGDFRKKTWPIKMRNDKIEEITIKWWFTQNDIPEIIEYIILRDYNNIYGRLPIWNNELRLKKDLIGEYKKFVLEHSLDI